MKFIHWFRDSTMLLAISLAVYLGFLAPALISAPSWIAILVALVIGYLLIRWLIAYAKSRLLSLQATSSNTTTTTKE
jgi:hypothetical protein